MAQLILRALEQEHPRAAYNYVIQSCSFESESPESFHWRLNIIPRMCKVAGFEWGSDCFINTVTPEEAALSMRKQCHTGTTPKAPVGSFSVPHSALHSNSSDSQFRIGSGNPAAPSHLTAAPHPETSPHASPSGPVSRLPSME